MSNTASRNVSSAISENVRAVPSTTRTNSGDVAILSYSGRANHYKNNSVPASSMRHNTYTQKQGYPQFTLAMVRRRTHAADAFRKLQEARTAHRDRRMAARDWN